MTPAAAPALPPARCMRLRARGWRYAIGLMRRRMPVRGGDAHHARRPLAAVLSLGAFIGMLPVGFDVKRRVAVLKCYHLDIRAVKFDCVACNKPNVGSF